MPYRFLGRRTETQRGLDAGQVRALCRGKLFRAAKGQDLAGDGGECQREEKVCLRQAQTQPQPILQIPPERR